jgi:hypothetical protein
VPSVIELVEKGRGGREGSARLMDGGRCGMGMGTGTGRTRMTGRTRKDGAGNGQTDWIGL